MGLSSRAQRHPNGFSTRCVSLFCTLSFVLGFLLVNRFWAIYDPIQTDEASYAQKPEVNDLLHFVNCDNKDASARAHGILSQTNDVIATFDKTISSLEIQLAAARAFKAENEKGFSLFTETQTNHLKRQQKVFCVMGIMTSFSNRKRRDSVRETWLPRWGELKKLEKEKGIIMRFVIGYSASSGGVLDRAIDAEEEQHKDFLRLQTHIEDYHELSLKTQVYFSTAIAIWDAEFYVKVDDDVHVNIGMLSFTLARHRSKFGVYIGCMKSGPVLAKKGIKYQEPEHWKFGEGNKYFRHATGQIYAISKDLANYIADNRHILHRYANEDVSLGSWFIGLDVEHIDERSLCCSTPHDCEWKAQAGDPCAASFDWSCSGICKSEERMEEVHQRCGEGDETIWRTPISETSLI